MRHRNAYLGLQYRNVLYNQACRLCCSVRYHKHGCCPLSPSFFAVALCWTSFIGEHHTSACTHACTHVTVCNLWDSHIQAPVHAAICEHAEVASLVLASSVVLTLARVPSVLIKSYLHAGTTCRATAGKAPSAGLDTINKTQAWASQPLRRRPLPIAHSP